MDQCISCSFSNVSHNFVLSAIYGSNDGMDRRRLWNHLSTVKGVVSNRAWLLVGDFNVSGHLSESSNFDGSQVPTTDIRDFTDCMQNLAVLDHTFTGPLFTWSNRQGVVYGNEA